MKERIFFISKNLWSKNQHANIQGFRHLLTRECINIDDKARGVQTASSDASCFFIGRYKIPKIPQILLYNVLRH